MANTVAYGFEQFANLMSDRVTTIGLSVVDDAITQSMEEHNRQLDAVTNSLVSRTTDFQTNFKVPVATRNQPLDEHGDPLPIRAAGHYTMAWPLQDSGNAIGWNWQTGLKMTVQEANDQVVTIQQGDVRWVMDQILAAVFQSAPYTFADPEHGSLTIQGLANGDSQVYQVLTGADAAGTDNHYLGQAAAITGASSDPFPTIWAELTEHPENGNGEVVAFVPTNLLPAIMALPGFRPLPDTNLKMADTITVLQATLGVRVPGRLWGYTDARVWIVEWRRLPNNYIVSFMTSALAPIRMRQDPLPELQGFVEMPREDDFPYTKRRWLRKAGFAGWNRVGACVMLIGNASYSTPAGYTRPMA